VLVIPNIWDWWFLHLHFPTTACAPSVPDILNSIIPQRPHIAVQTWMVGWTTAPARFRQLPSVLFHLLAWFAVRHFALLTLCYCCAGFLPGRYFGPSPLPRPLCRAHTHTTHLRCTRTAFTHTHHALTLPTPACAFLPHHAHCLAQRRAAHAAAWLPPRGTRFVRHTRLPGVCVRLPAFSSWI